MGRGGLCSAPRAADLLKAKALEAITWLCLVVGLGFKHRPVSSCDHGLVAWTEGPGGGKKCLWWETHRDDRTLNAVGDLWRHSDSKSLQNQDYLQLLAQSLAHDCESTFFEVIHTWWLHNFSATYGNAQSLFSTSLSCGSFVVSCFNIWPLPFALAKGHLRKEFDSITSTSFLQIFVSHDPICPGLAFL